jgi:predicted DNA-binding protein YlxM (UPF0122 family)
MNLTPEQLKMIEEYAGLFLSWRDIAVLLDLNPDDFYQEWRKKSSEIFKSYQKGQILRKCSLRRPVIKMAEHGSPQAEMLADKFFSEQLISELDD